MRIFYGAAIQGAKDRRERSSVNRSIIDIIKDHDFEVYTEHTTGKTYQEAILKLEESIGPMPTDDIARRVFVRDKMIEGIEGDIRAAVFEVSTPSLGTGVEIAHAYLRPRMGLSPIPILALYQKDYWPNELSTMLRGISESSVPNFVLRTYTDPEDLKGILHDFLTGLNGDHANEGMNKGKVQGLVHSTSR